MSGRFPGPGAAPLHAQLLSGVFTEKFGVQSKVSRVQGAV